MKRFLKFLLGSIVIVTISFSIFKFTDKYNVDLINKDIDWTIRFKGYNGARAFDFDEEDNLYIAFKDTIRVVSKDGKDEIIIRRNDFDIRDILCYKDKLFLATDNRIVEYSIKKDYSKELIKDIPNRGENKKIQLKVKDDLLYVAIGSNTNSGVVSKQGEVCDVATTSWILKGENYGDDVTGAFVDYGVKTEAGEKVKGSIIGNACIITYDLSTDEIKMFSHGIRNIKGWDINSDGKLIGIVGGIEDRGLRSVKDDKDYIYEFKNDTWYGWPDYSGGDPITSPRFTDGKVIEFLIENHIDKSPPAPIYQHKDLASLYGFAIDNKNVIFEKDTMIFADNNEKILYSLSKNSILKQLAQFGEDGFIESMKFNNGKLFILDSGLGCIYKLEISKKGILFNLPKVIWVFIIMFLIIISGCVVYKLNNRKIF